MDIRRLFLGGIEIDLQTAYRRLEKKIKGTLEIFELEKELDQNVQNGILIVRYSVKDPNEHSELKSFDTKLDMEVYKKSKNSLKNTLTGEQYSLDECVLVKYYRLVNPEYIYPGLNPVENSAKLSCFIFGCDAISFSKRDSDDQVRLYKNLIAVLSECLTELKIKPSNTICIPSGDGYFIIFHAIDDPSIIIKFAHAIQVNITEKSLSLPIRIGIEIGTVFKIQHKNNQINAIGHSLNSCARIMSFGKEKHILVSNTFYEACVNHSENKNNFRYCGEREDKHGYKYHIYNYSKDFVGNDDPIA